MNSRNLAPRTRAVLIVCGVLAVLVLAYALAGFLLVPWLAKRELPRMISEHLGAQARLSEAAFNPFTLTVRATDFAMETPNGEPLLRFREATAKVEWRSLARRVVVLSELRLVDPEVDVEISGKGELNLAALGGKRPASGNGQPSLPPVALENVVIDNGRVRFQDRRQKYQNSFEKLSLQLSSISTAQNDKGPYDLVAHTADGGKLSWKGEASIAPLALTGTLVFEHGALPQLNPYLESLSGARMTSGKAHLTMSHHLEIAGGKVRLDIRDGKLVVDGLAVAAGGVQQPFATIGRLALEGINGDLQARRASAQALRLAKVSVTARRDARGVFHPRVPATPAGPPSDAGAAKGAWQFSIANVTLSDGSASYADDEAGLALAFERIAVKIAALSSDATQPLSIEMEAGVAGGGQLSASGKAVIAAGTVAGRIEAVRFPIAPFQALIARHANVKLLSGSLSAAGELNIGGDTKTPRGRSARLVYSGAASLENVAIRDGAGAPLVQWKALATKSLRLSVAPDAARIDELRWTAPKARLEIATDGSTNLTRVFSGKEKGASPASRSAAPAPARTREDTAGAAAKKDDDRRDEAGGFPVRIRRVQVGQGMLDFTDRSLSPHFSTLIHGLAGTVNGISTDRDSRSQLELEGRVDKFGHARLSGSLNFFDPDQRTALRMQLRNLDVAQVSPYTIKFAGYRVNSGRMSLDLNYRVTNRRLQGDNKILLDNFVLGERVAGTEAPDLPLDLAVSLLKDENGRIDIAVPISGSLDDPEFKLSDVIWKAIGNIVRNIVSAPFRALGRLLGGSGEQLAAIAFNPGSSRLLPPEQEKLRRIVEGLAQRPELKLVIPARYDAEADAGALKRDGLRREIGKRAGFEIGGEGAGPINTADRRTRNALRGLFAERIGKDELERLKDEAERSAAGEDGKRPDIPIVDRVRNFASGEPQVADPSAFYRALFRRLVESQALPDGALEDLAQKRADTIAAELQAAGADPARVALSKAEPTANAEAKEITVQLSLAPAR